jgi:hypothetical protein
VYFLTSDSVQAEENATNVVTSTILLFGSIACMLFDSFISSSYVKLYRLATKPLELNMSVGWSTPPLLSAVQAIKNVRDGAQAYLVYVQAKPETQSKLEDIPMVCHYSDVFSGITSLPPDR